MGFLVKFCNLSALQFTEVSETEDSHQRRQASPAEDPQSSPGKLLDDLEDKTVKNWTFSLSIYSSQFLFLSVSIPFSFMRALAVSQSLL